MELLHISKAGGTSMCQLAQDSGLRSETTSMQGNCMVRTNKRQACAVRHV